MRGQKLHHRLIKKVTTDKLGHRTHNHQHWNDVRTRGTNTGDPCLYRYTNQLLVELKIQTLYERNTRRCTIKSTRGLIRSHLRASQARKQKSATDTSGIEHTLSHARDVRVSAVPIAACKMAIYIRP